MAEFCIMCGMDSNYDFIISELPKVRGQWQIIAAQADVKYSWLSKVASGAIPNPGVKGIDQVARVLRSRSEVASAA